MAAGRERPHEVRRTGALLTVLGVRVRQAEKALAEAREQLVEAERYHGVCEQDHEAEHARLAAIIAHLRSPEVSSSGPRYAEMLAMREIVARAIVREEYMFSVAVEELDAARVALGERRDELARLRSREDALRERLVAAGKLRAARLELATENEVEELASIRYALPGGVRR